MIPIEPANAVIKVLSDNKIFTFNLADLLKEMIHENDLSDDYLNYFNEKKTSWEANGLVAVKIYGDNRIGAVCDKQKVGGRFGIFSADNIEITLYIRAI